MGVFLLYQTCEGGKYHICSNQNVKKAQNKVSKTTIKKYLDLICLLITKAVLFSVSVPLVTVGVSAGESAFQLTADCRESLLLMVI